jgi:hypothetical protein
VRVDNAVVWAPHAEAITAKNASETKRIFIAG